MTPCKLLTFLCLSCLIYNGINNAYHLTSLLQRLNDIKSLLKPCPSVIYEGHGRLGEWYRAQNQGREVGMLLEEEQSKQKKTNRDGYVHPPCAWNGGISDICVT